MTTTTTTSGSDNTLFVTSYQTLGPARHTAHAVRVTEGDKIGLSYETYETPEAAKKDRLWRIGAEIVEVELRVLSVVEKREQTDTEKFIEELYHETP